MNRKTSNPGFGRLRNKALVGAIVSALALGAAGAVAAQSTGSYALDSSGPWAQTLALQNFLHTVNNTQSLYGNVSAQVSGTDSIFIDADGSGAPFTNSANSISALAVGNNANGNGDSANPNDNAGNSIALGLLGTSGANSGLGILSGQLSEGNTIKASANGASIATDLTLHTSGAVTTSGNGISVDTRVNDASSVITGALPTAAFNGANHGSAEGHTDFLPVGSFTLDGQADILVANTQVNANSANTAVASNDAIRITDATAGTVSADFTSNGNTISAGFSGNRSVNTFAANSGGAVGYAGSVAVANAQVSSAASGTSRISASGVTTDVTGTNNFTGTVSQSDNHLDASAQANAASNTLRFADGISVAGNGSATALNLEEFDYGSIFASTNTLTTGDLVLQNLQGTSSNDNTDGEFSAFIGDSSVTASVNSVGSAEASISVNANQVHSAAGGNRADNLLSADGASFTAGVAVGNQQENRTSSDISGSIDDLSLGAHMTAANRTSQGTVTVADNGIGAFANGNRASTDVDLSGTVFNVGGGTAFSGVGYLVDGSYENYASSSDAGIVVGNLQLNWVGAQASASESASATGIWLGASYAAAITAGAGTVDGNGIDADASGNVATTTLQLAGTNARTSAFLGNNQDSRNDIRAEIGDAFTGIEVTNGAVSNAALSVSANSMASSATGNQASNLLATDFTNAVLGNGDGVAWVNPNSSIDSYVPAAEGASALALFSQQVARADIDAATTGSSIAVRVDNGNVSAAPVTLNANLASASAIGNRVDNTLSPNVGTLATDGGHAAQIASLGSVQQTISYEIDARIDPGAGATGQIYAQVNAGVTGSAFSVADNRVDAFAGGNVTGNTMAITGNHFAPAAVGGGYNGDSYAGYYRGEVYAAFALQNSQLDGSYYYAGMRSATVDHGSLGVAVEGNVSGSPLSVTGNQVTADARSNYAGNTLGLGGFARLTTTAGLLSQQNAGGYYAGYVDVTGSIGQTYIGAGSLGGDVSESDVTVSTNALSARAIGNTGINTVRVEAGQLAGNSNDPVAPPFGLAPGTRGAFLALTPEALADYSLLSTQQRSATSLPPRSPAIGSVAALMAASQAAV